MADAGKDGQRPIIIKKIKKAGHGGHHGGAWKVAFADFATAMMALFLVLWLVGQSPKTKSAVGAYFRDPLGFSAGGNTELNSGPSKGGAGFFEGGNTAVALDTQLSGKSNGEGSGDGDRKKMMDLSNARNRLAQALMALRMDTWARHVELTAVEQGLRIEIQDSTDVNLFTPGGTKIRPEAKGVMTMIAEEVGMLPNRVVIEGHTDSTPGKGVHGNWELSTARANAARRFLVEHGVRSDQVVEVRGYADRRLRLWHDPKNPRNRRISVLVLLERPDPRERTKETLEEPHPLIKKLIELDTRAQGPGNEIELDPNGAKQ